MFIKLGIFLINCNLILAKNEYHILDLYDEYDYINYTTRDYSPNLLIKYDATAACNWTLGNEYAFEALIRFNRANFSNDPVYTFLTIEHGQDMFYFTTFNHGNDTEIDVGDTKIITNNLELFSDRIWHNFIIIFSRSEGFAQVALDCKDEYRFEIPKGNLDEKTVRKIPLIIGFPKRNIIHSVDIRKAKLSDKIGNRWDINCKDFEKRFVSQKDLFSRKKHH